jgi:tetratricopeptide (TPR) repeat protein
VNLIPLLSFALSASLLAGSAFGQARRPSTGGATNPLERAIDQSANGGCQEALPILKKLAASAADKQLKYRALIATVRCGLNRKEDQTSVNALFELKRDFPEDPQVLYMTSQLFLEIAERASQELASSAPESYQAKELQAETFESQEKWADAATIYRKILEENPKLRGIHYRLARAALSQPDLPNATEEAKKEFALELTIDPYNSAAEFWLGELARREGQWDDAIAHFSAAGKIDPTFGDAVLSLGTVLNSAGKYADAIPHLEQYIKIAPSDPAGHYQLAMAYARTNRRDDSVRELTLQRQLAEKQQAATDARSGASPH